MSSVAVPLVHVRSDSSPSEQFHELVYRARRPALLRGIPLGPATSLWTPSYLVEKCGEREVKVHVSPVEQMDFVAKNFIYRRASMRQCNINCSYRCTIILQNIAIFRVCETRKWRETRRVLLAQRRLAINGGIYKGIINDVFLGGEILSSITWWWSKKGMYIVLWISHS